MANRYKLKEVLQALYNKAATVCDNVFTSSRPIATERMEKFIVVRLPQGIDPYADTHNIAYAQIVCFVRDKQGGIENVSTEEEMIDSISALFPFSDSLIACNETPLILGSKSDGLGFHSIIIQFKIYIKV